MKKITHVFVTLLIIFYLPVTLPAAQKTMTIYDISPTTTSPNNPNSPYNTASPTYNPDSPASNTKDFGVTKTGLGSQPAAPTDTSTPTSITDSGTASSFPPVVNNPSNPSVTIDPGTQSIVMGSSINDGSGAMWYGGTSPAGTCNPCTAGVCTFGLGFRAYFEFKFATQDSSANSNANADGFTFAIVNASNNNINKRGGPPNATFSLGELMGYAGPGNTATSSSSPAPTPPPLDGLGLEPPKMAIEFDTYPNPGALHDNGCSGGRNDHNNNNHIALMFWGQNPASTTMCVAGSTAGNTFPQASFDDNVHGAGAGTTSSPYNSAFSGNGSGLGGYYERAIGAYNWLEDAQYHRARIEVIRTSSTQTYQIKAWVDCESCTTTPCTACPGNEYVYFQDVYNPYNNSSYLPKIDRTQQLTTALNTSLDQILFGFTEGTGASTQIIQITNFVIYFPPSTISSTSANYTACAASSQTVSVTGVATASTSCAWTAVSNNSWITITGGASGTGIGTVTYSVDTNTGAARTGTITIGGQIFTVNQATAQYNVATHACFRSSDNRVYVNADITGGTPASVRWAIDGVDQGALSNQGGTLWGSNRTGCGLTNADRANLSTGTHNITVTATNAGSCISGSNTVQVTRP
jgi:hypothetical protein